MNLIISFDQQLTHLLKNLFPNLSYFNQFFSFFSLKGNSLIIWILVIILVVILEEKKNPGISKNDKKFLIVFSLSFLITVFLVEIPLKNLFQRPRPVSFLNKFQLLSTCPNNSSFPSGHSATAFAASTVLSFFHKKRKWLYYSIATLIAYSRIYLGCHYFFDVVFGAFFGWLMAKLFIKIASFLTF